METLLNKEGLESLKESVVTDYFQQLLLANKNDSPNKLIIVEISRTDWLNRQDLLKNF